MKKEREDLYLYSRVTQFLVPLDVPVIYDIESPFVDLDGNKLHITLSRERIHGIAPTNYRTQKLEESRGKIIIINGSNVVGRVDTDNNVTLFATHQIEKHIVKLLYRLQRHLTENGINVNISLDERLRFKLCTRRSKGDYIQGRR